MSWDKSCNCFVCSKEFDPEELQSGASSKINLTRFKICQACLDNCDPSDDYRQVRDIVSSYLWFAEAKTSLGQAASLIDQVNKKKE